MSREYDLVVIGAGPGGYIGAVKAAELGMKVAVVEEREVGGTCLNRGCIPTKTLMHSSHLYYEIRQSEKIGLKLEGISYDYAKLHERKNEVIKQLREGVTKLLNSHKVDIISGKAKILSYNKENGKKTIQVSGMNGEEQILSDKILIATGSKPAIPPIKGTNLSQVVTSDELLTRDELFYQRLVIIGGGVIGVEFATLYQELGCEVTIIEAQNRILSTMDKDISQSVAMSLKKKGVTIYTSATVDEIIEEQGVHCRFTYKNEKQSIETDGILLSTGRMGNTEGLLDESIGIKMDRDKIEVNEYFETNISGIYGIGDVIKGIQLAHIASAQGIVVAEYMNHREPSINLSVVPSCIYTSPEVASVGLTEPEAKELGIPITTKKYPMLANSKTILSLDERGYMKAIFDANTDKIIGAQLVCGRATDMVGEFATGIVNGLTRKDLASVIRPHPTYEEAISEVVGK